jgi:hypothetical protein
MIPRPIRNYITKDKRRRTARDIFRSLVFCSFELILLIKHLCKLQVLFKHI